MPGPSASATAPSESGEFPLARAKSSGATASEEGTSSDGVMALTSSAAFTFVSGSSSSDSPTRSSDTGGVGVRETCTSDDDGEKSALYASLMRISPPGSIAFSMCVAPGAGRPKPEAAFADLAEGSRLLAVE